MLGEDGGEDNANGADGGGVAGDASGRFFQSEFSMPTAMPGRTSLVNKFVFPESFGATVGGGARGGGGAMPHELTSLTKLGRRLSPRRPGGSRRGGGGDGGGGAVEPRLLQRSVQRYLRYLGDGPSRFFAEHFSRIGG